MDIIDIMLARAMTPQGQTEIYVNKANKAAAKAEKAEQDAATAIATVDAAADDIAAAQAAATALLEDAQDALETAQSAMINMPEVYTTTGQNTDGYMTQKAVTDALAAKADSSALAGKMDTFNLSDYASKSYVTSAIAAIPASSGSSSATVTFNPSDAGYIVTIDENGHLQPGNILENDLLALLHSNGEYTIKGTVGLDMDYANKTFARLQDATTLSMGADFNQFTMYGGRIRCNVADNGTINAFYGDSAYKEDGSNGQVMVYQPKFYYQRLPITTVNLSKGKVIRHETLILSDVPKEGFKLAPIFKSGNNELEYVLFSAYEGSLVNDKLTSIAGTKPVSNTNIVQMESAANARGTGWHIENMAAVSANQMLEIVEFGMMNGQQAIEKGICQISGSNEVNCASLTGSTASLGNNTGHATQTISDINGSQTQEFADGKRAISYRGIENPWGNIWHMIGGINIKGDGQSLGGTPYICTNFNYTSDQISSNYEEVGFNLPAVYGWISGMGLGSEKYDWVFLPAECASFATSALPVGDNLWVTAHTTENKIVAYGGTFNLEENNGPFYYAADRASANSARANYGARLMYIPTQDSIYTENITKWTNKLEG